jgi:hypothetical protein
MRMSRGDKSRDATTKKKEIASLSRFRSSGSGAAISCTPFKRYSIDLPATTSEVPRPSPFFGDGPICVMAAQLVHAKGRNAEDSTSVPPYDSSNLN